MRELRKSGAISEGTDAVICILGDWESVAEGIIFTNHAMYVQTPKNSNKKFKVRYDEIRNLRYEKHQGLFIDTETDQFIVDTALWSERSVYDFLQFACEKYDFEKTRKSEILQISWRHRFTVAWARFPLGRFMGL